MDILAQKKELKGIKWSRWQYCPLYRIKERPCWCKSVRGWWSMVRNKICLSSKRPNISYLW